MAIEEMFGDVFTFQVSFVDNGHLIKLVMFTDFCVSF